MYLTSRDWVILSRFQSPITIVHSIKKILLSFKLQGNDKSKLSIIKILYESKNARYLAEKEDLTYNRNAAQKRQGGPIETVCTPEGARNRRRITSQHPSSPYYGMASFFPESHRLLQTQKQARNSNCRDVVGASSNDTCDNKY